MQPLFTLIALLPAAVIIPPLPGPYVTGEDVLFGTVEPTIDVALPYQPSGLGRAIEAGYIRVQFLEGVQVANSVNFGSIIEADLDNAVSGAVEVRPVCVDNLTGEATDNGDGDVFSWTESTWDDPMTPDLSILVDGPCAAGTHREVITIASISDNPTWTGGGLGEDGGWQTNLNTPVTLDSNQMRYWLCTSDAPTESTCQYRDVLAVITNSAGYAGITTNSMDVYIGPLSGTGTCSATARIYMAFERVDSSQITSTSWSNPPSGDICSYGSGYFKQVGAALDGTGLNTMGFRRVGAAGSWWGGILTNDWLLRWYPADHPSPPPIEGDSGTITSFASSSYWTVLDQIKYHDYVPGENLSAVPGMCTSIANCLTRCADDLTWNPLELFHLDQAFACAVIPHVRFGDFFTAAKADLLDTPFLNDLQILVTNVESTIHNFVTSSTTGCDEVTFFPATDYNPVITFDTCILDTGGTFQDFIRYFVDALVVVFCVKLLVALVGFLITGVQLPVGTRSST